SLNATDNGESAIIASLAAGNYTVIVRGNNGTTGVALVEAYRLHEGLRKAERLDGVSPYQRVSTKIFTGRATLCGAGLRPLVFYPQQPSAICLGLPELDRISLGIS